MRYIPGMILILQTNSAGLGLHIPSLLQMVRRGLYFNIGVIMQIILDMHH